MQVLSVRRPPGWTTEVHHRVKGNAELHDRVNGDAIRTLQTGLTQFWVGTPHRSI